MNRDEKEALQLERAISYMRNPAMKYDRLTQMHLNVLMQYADDRLEELQRRISFKRKTPCSDCSDGYCIMNCGPALRPKE